MYIALTIIFFIKCLSFALITANGNVNDTCQVARTGAAGICQYWKDCPVVLNEMSANPLLYPSYCGWHGRKRIICCPVPPATQPATRLIQSNRTSAKKCVEYQKAVVDDYGVFRCSISTVPLIVGGEDALPKEFPHMALIGFDIKDISTPAWKCGGTLISEQFILTAAHCVYDDELGYAKYVLLGELDRASETDDALPQQFNVIEHFVHPDFRKPSKYNDIALLRLNRSVQINQYIRPACLPQSNSLLANKITAAGWGKTDNDEPLSDRMQKVQLEFFTHTECNATYESQIGDLLPNGIIDSLQVCAGSHTDRNDTCQGDSGGPIQNYDVSVSCMYSIVGVTSFGSVECGSAGIPGVYTRVFAYLDWIEGVVWPEERMNVSRLQH